MLTDTITAIATSLSNSGISIIRISGRDSLEIINKIFKTNHKLEPNHIVYGKIYKEDMVLDNVLVSYFKSPVSFTGEDICEINCHGGTGITRQILELVLESGARLADAGEFSKRAFLNGKMDLIQAEAVIDLINAKSSTETKIATRQLEGTISKKIKELREELIELIAHIEVSVDYPEYDIDAVDNTNVENILSKKINEINKILETYEQGKYIKNGVNVAILGKPNAGKSSLLNMLSNSDRAIVTDIPGTTRDIVEETINIGEITLNISDTAGIRDTNDIVEKLGVERSIKILDETDLVIYMIDGTEYFNEEDKKILSKIQNKGIKYIVVINKIDEVQKLILDTVLEELKIIGVEIIIPISIKEEKNINILKSEIINMFLKNDFDYEHEFIITNLRHKDLLKKSVEYLFDAKSEVEKGNPIDIIGIYITKATKTLGEVIGADISEDVVKKIFEKFCLGK